MGTNIEDCTNIIIKNKNTGEIVQEVDFNSAVEQIQKDNNITKDRKD